MNNRVSCIIPVYNGERFLAETLASIYAQSYPLHEIWLVDDGSTDGTAALVQAEMVKAPLPLHYHWQANAGPATARNFGITHSEGDFVAMIDADDLWRPQKIERQMARFAADPRLAISVTHLQNFWMEEMQAEAEQMRDHPRAKAMAGYSFSTALVRRSVFAEIGLLNPALRHSDDTEWFMRAKDAQIADELMADVLVDRRLHRHNQSRIYARESRQEYLRLLKTRIQQRPAATPASGA